MSDQRLLELLEELALLLELRGENPFKAAAYARAARTLATQQVDLRRLVEEGRLRELPGIGPALEEVITEYVRTGRIQLYEQLRQELPEGLLELTQLPGVGVKRARILYEQLGISSPEELERACHEHRIAALKGFGAKTEAALLQALAQWRSARSRLHLHKAWEQVRLWQEQLLQLPELSRVIPTGEVRRYTETVGELQLLLVSPHPGRLLRALQKAFPEFHTVAEDELLAEHRHRRIRLWLSPPEHAGWRLLQTTGSEEFVRALSEELRARDYEPMGSELRHRGHPISAHTEEELFALVGLPFIPPELRESAHVLELVRREGLPKLVERRQMVGMLHVHSTWSDGKASIRQMALAAKELGYAYLAICDHSAAAFYANGLSAERLQQQWHEIEQLNAEGLGIRLLKGIEVDILPDGSLDYPDELLGQLELVVASVHSHFRQSRQEMTRRILRALEHPYVHILGHPTGRLLLSRPPYEVDVAAILQTALRLGKIIELNAQPYRFDLSWEELQRARSQGLRIAINPDAHTPAELEYMEFGVRLARKALFPPEQVVNTLSAEELLALCRSMAAA
jgi:DNA polymerase (family 10)